MKSSSNLKILGLCAAVGGLLAAGSGSASDASTVTETIAMHALNNSGQTGTATITDVGGKVLVTVSLTGEPSGASEPAHVHFGRCPKIKAVPAYNVGPILHGKGSDVVQLTWAEINSGKFAVNVHKSASDMGTYVSCGNIGR
jgi:Cu/Zn superoxide dismutase